MVLGISVNQGYFISFKGEMDAFPKQHYFYLLQFSSRWTSKLKRNETNDARAGIRLCGVVLGYWLG